MQIKRIQDNSKESVKNVDEKKNINLTLLPPENLQILRRVGSDGLLVSWSPPEDDEVTGYLVSSTSTGCLNKKSSLESYSVGLKRTYY